MKDYIFAKQLIYGCLYSFYDLNYLGSLMKSIDHENLLSTWLVLSNDIDKWNGFSNEVKFPIQKLIYLAKNNNIDKYNEIVLIMLSHQIDDCITDTPYDVSKVFYELFKYKYKYVSKNFWYIYNDNLNDWVLDEDYVNIKRDITQELRKIFIERCFYYWNKMGKTIDQNLRDEYDMKGTICSEISLHLRRINFINDVITESKCLFIDEWFENKK